MIAAIYARKSTDQTGVSDEARSVARQVEHAKAYAARKGWAVDDAYVFVDDGISGAEFAGRPGFVRLMNALKPRAPFQVLVMSEESRLGREAIETAFAVKQLVTAGVRLFFYLEDRERTLDSPTDKLLMHVAAFADELEREKARQRTFDAMIRKARAGQVTGGRTFGYDNFDVMTTGPDGQPHRSHVERRINGAEAAVVRRIFELSAEGRGMTTIAKLLNGQGARPPRPQLGRPAAWASSSVREILHRRVYRGEVTWNATRKRNQWGVKQQRARPEREWLRVPAPDLRIVDDALWKASHARMDSVRTAYMRGTKGRLFGRPRTGTESKYLLTGFCRCGACGGGMFLHTRGGKVRRALYACTGYHKRGRSVCQNNLEVPMDLADRAVIAGIRDTVLRPAIVDAALEEALRMLAEPTPGAARADALEAELTTLGGEIERLVTAMAAGGDLPALVEGLRARERRRQDVVEQLAGARQEAPRRFNQVELKAELRRRLRGWRALLLRNVPEARALLRLMLPEPIIFTPDVAGERRGYRFRARVHVGRLLSGVIDPTSVASPGGRDDVYDVPAVAWFAA
jgi:site-specific DNA recombinase